MEEVGVLGRLDLTNTALSMGSASPIESGYKVKMELEPVGNRKQEPNDLCTLDEFISGILRESIPDGEYRRLFDTIVGSYSRRSQDDLQLELLPSITCSALAGNPIKAIPATAAWWLVRLAAKLFDDVEDGEAGDRSAEINNLATGCLFTAHVALEKLPDCGISSEQYRRVKNRFNQACLQSCAGQNMDLSLGRGREIPTPDQWLEIARSKSGMLFAWASWAGAAVATACSDIQDSFWEYGLHIGILVQIADDYNEIWGRASKNDLPATQVSLPISYAHLVANTKERDTLLSLLWEARLGSLNAWFKSQDLITILGAQKFILTAAQFQREDAIRAFKHMDLPRLANNRLLSLLDHIFPALVHFPLISDGVDTKAWAKAI